MIFKQIDSSVDKTRKTLALFNKDWNTYKSNWQNANGIKGKIGSIFTSSNTNTSIISNEQVQILRNWNNAVAHGCTSQETFNRIIANADDNTKMYFAGLNKGKGSIEGLKKAQNVATQSTIGLTIAQTALNMAISLGLTALISLIVKRYDKLANSVENCKERVDDLISSYKSALETANNNANRVEELVDKYEKLSKGVNSLGENVSLTNEEYEEYNSSVNEIAEMFPTLVQGWTDEGTAVLNLKGNIEQLRDAYKEAQQEAYNLLIISGKDSDGNDIIKQWEYTHDTGFWASLLDLGADDIGGGISVSDALKQLKAIQNMTAEEYREIERITGAGSRKEIAGLSDIEKDIGYGSYLYKALGLDSTVTDEDFREAQRQARALIQTYNAEIESALSDVETLANAYLMTNEDYDKLDEQSKTAASMLVNSLNADIANTFSSKEDVGVYVDKIVQSILSNSKAKDALKELFTMDTSGMSIDKIKKQTDSYINTIAEVLKEDPIELKTRLGFDDSDTQPLINNVKEKLQDEFDDKVGELTLEELQIAAEQVEVPEGTFLSWDELIAKIEEAKRLASNDSTSLSISQTIDQLNTRLKPAFDSLQSAYQDIFTDDGEFALNSIDILSTCDSIKSKLDDMSELGLNVDYSSFEDFVRVLNNTESTEQDVETAFDSLATSITQAALSGAEDFETMKAALEDLGVVNNEIVAFDALIKNTEALKEAGLDLTEATYDEIETFVKGIGITENYTQAVNLLKIQKILCAGNPLDTSGDIMNLYLLANAAGIATDAILQLMRLNAEYTKASAEGNTAASLVALGQIEVVKQTVLNQFANLGSEVDFGNIGGGTSAASKAGSSAGDAYVSAFEEELAALEDLRDRGVIDEAEYLRRLRELYTRYFADRKEYLDELKKYERQYLEGMKSLYESALSGITKLMDSKIDGYTHSKEAAIESLEAEKQAAEDAYQAQIDALDDLIGKKQESIDGIQKEIDAMKEAREERQRQLNLQKAQYDLERMQNQRTILQYSAEKGLHYVTDASGIRDAKEKVGDAKFDIDVAKKEKEIKLLEDAIGLLEKQKEALEEEKEKSAEYYDSLIAQQEKYWDSMIKNMEQQKSKWEELAEIEEIAQAYSAIEQVFGELGYSVEDILNGSESAFEDFKSRYIAIMSELNQNTSFQEGLEYASGVAKENFGSIVSDAQNTVQELSQAFSDGTFSQAITQGVSDGIVSAKQELDNMNQLGMDAGDGLLNGWDEKSNLFIEAAKQAAQDAVDAFAEGQDSHSPSVKYQELAGDAIDGLLFGIEENKLSFIDAVRSLAEEGVLAFEEGFTFENSTLNTSFDALKVLIESVTEALGLGTEGTVGGLLGALTQLSNFSFNESSIVEQFNNLKTAIDSVTSAISGESGSPGSGRQGGSLSSAQVGKDSSKGPKGTGKDGGSSLTSAIAGIGTTAKEVIGEPGAEGDGSVIGTFGSLRNAINEATGAIGTGDPAAGDKGTGKSSGSGNDDNLAASIISFGEQTDEVLGKPGGNGVIGRFEEFKKPLSEADEHIHSIADGLDDIDGKEVTCTITVNVNQNGSISAGGTGVTVTNPTNSSNTEYTATYSKTSTESTGSIRTGSTPANTVIAPDGHVFSPVQTGGRAWELQQAFKPIIEQLKSDNNFEFLSGSAVIEHNKQMEQMIRQLNTTNVVNNNKNVQPMVHNEIHVTLPNVTNSTSAEALLRDLESLSTKKFQINW